jgi:branched-chain amino acid transport system ATP-binding protein
VPLLEVSDLRAGYGAVPVLHGVTLSVDEGETVAMLGLNGAGKTTTLLCMAGLQRPWGGEVHLDGAPVTAMDARDLVKRGIVLVPEGRHVFPGLSVDQNLRLGAWPKRKDRTLMERNRAMVFEIFPHLAERRSQLAGTLSGGEQQMLSLGRGLMASPRVLLIDEASLGLSPRLTQEVFRATRRINGEGITVFMVEQNAGILRYVDRTFVMEKGRITFEGAGADLLQRAELRTAYLGTPA